MRSRHEQKIRDGARPFLEEGESVVAAFLARPRGWTQSVAGGRPNPEGMVAAAIGDASQARAYAAGERAEFRLASPMALAITERRLLVFGIGSPIGLGIGGRVKELVSAAPLSDVDAIEIRRLAIGKVVTVTVRGVPIKIEANAFANARGVAEALRLTKDGA